MVMPVAEAIRSAGAGAMALRERWRSGVSYNPFSARTVQDLYPVYAALRSRAWRVGSSWRCCSNGSRGSACLAGARGSAWAS